MKQRLLDPIGVAIIIVFAIIMFALSFGGKG